MGRRCAHPWEPPAHCACLRLGLERLGEHRREVLSALERLHRNVDGRHALRRAGCPGEDVSCGTLLESDVIIRLQEEVWHHLGVLLGLSVADLLEVVVGSHRAEDLLAVDRHDRLGIAALGRAAPVGVHGDGLAVLGDDREAHLGEVGELLARGSRQRQAARVLGIRRDRGDVVDSDAVVRCEQCELVDSHILQHALSVALEALAELLLLVRVVVHKLRLRARCLLLKLECLEDVRRHVLVVAHVHRHALLLRILHHLLELGDGRRAGLLEVDVRAAGSDHILQQLRVVCGAARDEGEARALNLKLGNVLHKLGAILALHLLRPLAEDFSRRRVGARAEEVGLDDSGHLGRRHVALEHLFTVVPAHATLGHPTADKHNIALLRAAATEAGNVVDDGA
mmetsp:Transcript_20937/g.53525  ORF Transcript_20937/g.53525 Transcript_20937/m.53525 type:complete len:397 (+) Transcript_20937:484-1674(+)